MKQSKLGSLIETCINTLIGFCVAYFAWPVAAYIWDIPYNHGQHFGVVLFFTVISVARGYAVRRWFNHMIHSASVGLAKKLNP